MQERREGKGQREKGILVRRLSGEQGSRKRRRSRRRGERDLRFTILSKVEVVEGQALRETQDKRSRGKTQNAQKGDFLMGVDPHYLLAQARCGGKGEKMVDFCIFGLDFCCFWGILWRESPDEIAISHLTG